MKHLSIATESIAFQSTAFFKDMTLIVTDLIASGKQTDEAAAPYFARIDRCVYDHIGITTSMKLWGNVEAAVILVPALAKGNVLHGPSFSKWLDKKFDAEKLSFLNIDKKGWVDPLTSRVGGAFSEIVFNAYIGGGFLFSKKYNAEEIATQIIHEVGHAFTFLQFIADTVIINAVLQRTHQELMSKNVDATIRVTLTRAADELAIKNRAWLEALETTSDREVAFRLLVSAVQIEPREMDNKRYFSQDACEELADIFVARHGGARALVSARSKFSYAYPSSFGVLSSVAFSAYGIIMLSIIAFIGVVFIFLSTFILFGSLNLAAAMPDITTFKKSATKMRNQMIEQLKQSKLPKEDILAAIANIEAIDEMIQSSRENTAAVPSIVRFIDMFRRGKMDSRTSREYTDKLEVMVSNDLFLRAAQLGTRNDGDHEYR